ncbi:MAG: hypothetical protein CMJ75_08990 [Planctomycetaceae bacterium]|nr:hypothetical protein [Planctomycetaceae bacterium]
MDLHQEHKKRKASLCVFGNFDRTASVKTPPFQGGEKATRFDAHPQEDNWCGSGELRQQLIQAMQPVWQSRV